MSNGTGSRFKLRKKFNLNIMKLRRQSNEQPTYEFDGSSVRKQLLHDGHGTRINTFFFLFINYFGVRGNRI